MTRTEISEKVFLRHLSSGALSDALGVVEKLSNGTFTQERSVSNIVGRWIICEVANLANWVRRIRNFAMRD